MAGIRQVQKCVWVERQAKNENLLLNDDEKVL